MRIAPPFIDSRPIRNRLQAGAAESKIVRVRFKIGKKRLLESNRKETIFIFLYNKLHEIGKRKKRRCRGSNPAGILTTILERLARDLIFSQLAILFFYVVILIAQLAMRISDQLAGLNLP